nr:LysR family transcriptional regulator [uncultured Oscillibacter sp.]
MILDMAHNILCSVTIRSRDSIRRKFVNTKDCWYVSTIAASRSFSKAAELCYIAPSALSRYISKLEDRLSIKIFDRSTTPISLTPAGTLYLYYAQQFLKLEEKLEIELDSLRNPAKTVVSLGVPIILGDYILPRFLPRFWLKDSAVTVNLDQDMLHYLEKKIVGHSLDIAFLCKPLSVPGYRSELITKEKILLITSRTNPALERYQYGKYDYQHPLELDLSTLKNVTFLHAKPHSFLYIEAEKWFPLLHFTPVFMIKITSPVLAMNQAAQSSSFTCVMNSQLKYGDPEIVNQILPIAFGDAYLPIYLVCSEEQYRNCEAYRQLVITIQEEFQACAEI